MNRCSQSSPESLAALASVQLTHPTVYHCAPGTGLQAMTISPALPVVCTCGASGLVNVAGVAAMLVIAIIASRIERVNALARMFLVTSNSSKGGSNRKCDH